MTAKNRYFFFFQAEDGIRDTAFEECSQRNSYGCSEKDEGARLVKLQPLSRILEISKLKACNLLRSDESARRMGFNSCCHVPRALASCKRWRQRSTVACVTAFEERYASNIS